MLVVIPATTRTAVTAETIVSVRSGLLTLVDDRLCQVALAIDLAAADPNLNTDDTHLSVCLSETVIDVSTERVERGATLLEHLLAGHLGAVETSGDLDLDALSLIALRLDDLPVKSVYIDEKI